MTSYGPAPARNRTAAGVWDRATDLVTSTTVRVMAGDYTGGTPEDKFTLSTHGLVTGDVLHVLWQSAMGAITGGEGLRCYVKKTDADIIQVTDSAGTVIENTADGTVVFLKGDIDSAFVQTGIIPNIIVGAHDFTSGTAEDIDVPAQGTKGLYEADTIKLVYKSAAGTSAAAADGTVFAKAPTVTLFQTAATAGGAVQDTTADGTNVWLKTS